MKFRKKPIVIEAEQAVERIEIETLEGTMVADPGDWIITGVKGERYPCKPDIFEMTYEAVTTMKCTFCPQKGTLSSDHGPVCDSCSMELPGDQMDGPLEMEPYWVEPKDPDKIEKMFTFSYEPGSEHQTQRFETLRLMAMDLAKGMIELAPVGRDQDKALKKLHNSLMLISSAISHE